MNIKKDEHHPMLVKQVELTLAEAKNLLFRIDSEIDKLEGKGTHESFLAIQDLMLEWNLLGHNFTSRGIHDWVEEPSK